MSDDSYDSVTPAPTSSTSSTATATHMVAMDDVQKWFGDLHVLKDINLRVSPGEVVVVIGPSGSGKSTLCRAINRLETIESGSITIDGKTQKCRQQPVDYVTWTDLRPAVAATTRWPVIAYSKVA